MPTFYEETDFDISVDDFLEECNSREITEIIEYLEEMGYLKSYEKKYSKAEGVMEEIFQEKIKKISESKHRLTLEEEDIIAKIADRL